jgi:hypothetical protein
MANRPPPGVLNKHNVEAIVDWVAEECMDAVRGAGNIKLQDVYRCMCGIHACIEFSAFVMRMVVTFGRYFLSSGHSL